MATLSPDGLCKGRAHKEPRKGPHGDGHVRRPPFAVERVRGRGATGSGTWARALRGEATDSRIRAARNHSLHQLPPPAVERTAFDFNGHHYDVGSMEFGNIVFIEAGRPAVRGYETASGVRLTLVTPPLDQVERELSSGLALRSARGDEVFWQEE